ncbi:HEAT repeat-containing protein 2 [Chytridiales sp. JEL 0842]|nr:HEAT repeat-containing protein 2 [Chytridiales sp. JEL 0842]
MSQDDSTPGAPTPLAAVPPPTSNAPTAPAAITGGMVVEAPDARNGDIVIDTAALVSKPVASQPPKSDEMASQGTLPPELSSLHVDIIRSLQRDINILSEPTSDRLAKRRALEKIQKETVGRASKGLDPRLATALLGDLCKTLLKCFSDPVEKCRELAVTTIAGFTPLVHDLIPSLPFTIPVFSARLANLEIIEPSEEIRLLLLTSFVSIVERAGPIFAPGVEEAVKILNRTLLDPFPDVKKESCKLIMSLCKHCPEAFRHFAPGVSKCLAQSLQHRHSAVRVTAIKALEESILTDASGLDDLADILKNLTMDKTSAVREALYTTTAIWLTKLIDRYSLGHKVMPCLLAGLTDELPKLREQCVKYLDDIGALYEIEWESRLKDEIDYTTGLARPRVGARHLARDNTQKIVNKMVEGMQDWSADVRAKSAGVLAAFMWYTEDNITGYIGTLLPVMYRVLSGDEPHVMQQTLITAETLGRYVKPSMYMDLFASHIKNAGGSTTSFRIGYLRTFHSILKGTPKELLSEFRSHVTGILMDKDMVGNENVGLLAEVATVAKVLCEKMVWDNTNNVVGEEGYALFSILISLSSVHCDEKVPGYVEMHKATNEAFSLLSRAHNAPQDETLYAIHFDTRLGKLQSSCPYWSKFSSEMRVLETLLLRSGPLVGERLEAVVGLIASGASVEKEPEVISSVLQTFLKLLKISPTPLNSSRTLPEFSGRIITSIVIPNATWRAGRKLSAIRGLAMDILLQLLSVDSQVSGSGCIGVVKVAELMDMLKEGEKLLPVMVGCYDEDEQFTRLTALNASGHLLEGIVRENLAFGAANFKLVYPDLLKRLDDASDDIRILTCNVFKSFAKALGSWHAQNPTPADGSSGYLVDNASGGKDYIEVRLDDVHWIEMVKGVAIHVDDSSAAIQEAASSALLELCVVAPLDVVKEQIAHAKTRFRNAKGSAKKTLESNTKILKNHVQIHGLITAIHILIRIALRYKSFTFWLGTRFVVSQAVILLLFRQLYGLAKPSYAPDAVTGASLQDGGVDLGGKGIHEYAFDVIYILWFTFIAACYSESAWYAVFIIPVFGGYKIVSMVLPFLSGVLGRLGQQEADMVEPEPSGKQKKEKVKRKIIRASRQLHINKCLDMSIRMRKLENDGQGPTSELLQQSQLQDEPVQTQKATKRKRDNRVCLSEKASLIDNKSETKSKKPRKTPTAISGPEFSHLELCPLCGNCWTDKELKTGKARISHLKDCAKTYGKSVGDMIELVRSLKERKPKDEGSKELDEDNGNEDVEKEPQIDPKKSVVLHSEDEDTTSLRKSKEMGDVMVGRSSGLSQLSKQPTADVPAVIESTSSNTKGSMERTKDVEVKAAKLKKTKSKEAVKSKKEYVDLSISSDDDFKSFKTKLPVVPRCRVSRTIIPLDDDLCDEVERTTVLAALAISRKEAGSDDNEFSKPSPKPSPKKRGRKPGSTNKAKAPQKDDAASSASLDTQAVVADNKKASPNSKAAKAKPKAGRRQKPQAPPPKLMVGSRLYTRLGRRTENFLRMPSATSTEDLLSEFSMFITKKNVISDDPADASLFKCASLKTVERITTLLKEYVDVEYPSAAEEESEHLNAGLVMEDGNCLNLVAPLGDTLPVPVEEFGDTAKDGSEEVDPCTDLKSVPVPINPDSCNQGDCDTSVDISKTALEVAIDVDIFETAPNSLDSIQYLKDSGIGLSISGSIEFNQNTATIDFEDAFESKPLPSSLKPGSLSSAKPSEQPTTTSKYFRVPSPKLSLDGIHADDIPPKENSTETLASTKDRREQKDDECEAVPESPQPQTHEKDPSSIILNDSPAALSTKSPLKTVELAAFLSSTPNSTRSLSFSSPGDDYFPSVQELLFKKKETSESDCGNNNKGAVEVVPESPDCFNADEGQEVVGVGYNEPIVHEIFANSCSAMPFVEQFMFQPSSPIQESRPPCSFSPISETMETFQEDFMFAEADCVDSTQVSPMLANTRSYQSPSTESPTTPPPPIDCPPYQKEREKIEQEYETLVLAAKEKLRVEMERLQAEFESEVARLSAEKDLKLSNLPPANPPAAPLSPMPTLADDFADNVVEDVIEPYIWEDPLVGNQDIFIHFEPENDDEAMSTIQEQEIQLVHEEIRNEESLTLTQKSRKRQKTTSTKSSTSKSASQAAPKANVIQKKGRSGASNAAKYAMEDMRAEGMPDYNSMSDAQLKKLSDKYGLRKLSKPILVDQLIKIWISLNPSRTLSLNNKSSIKTALDLVVGDEDDDDEEGAEIEEEILPRRKKLAGKIGESEHQQPLEERLTSLIKNNADIYCRILRYEPLDLIHVHQQTITAGISCSKKELGEFLERRGMAVINTTAVGLNKEKTGRGRNEKG